MLNIVVPMAGLGSRFAQAGYTLPKPLIPVHDVPMIEVVANNLRPSCEHRFIFICQAAHMEEFGLRSFLSRVAPGCIVVGISGLTQGAACTVLCAKEHINDHHPLMIANSDQWINYSMDEYLSRFDTQQYAGQIMTMTASHPKWSFIRQDEHGRITEVVEKQVVSNEATCGIYNFAHGRDFVQAAEAMIARNSRVNNEFYVAPTYNLLLEKGCELHHVNIGTDGMGMHGLGVPEDLERFLASSLSLRAVSAGRLFTTGEKAA